MYYCLSHIVEKEEKHWYKGKSYTVIDSNVSDVVSSDNGNVLSVMSLCHHEHWHVCYWPKIGPVLHWHTLTLHIRRT